MSQCPNCKHPELEGAIFCSQCGAAMTDLHNRFGTQVTLKTIDPRKFQSGSGGHTAGLYGLAGNDLALHFLDSGKILPLSGCQEYILGRTSDDQPEKPGIDLSDYQAYEKGVSRLHASIRKMDGILNVTDLGSSNGTRLNGARLASQQAYPLQHGDILSLGKLKIQILIRK